MSVYTLYAYTRTKNMIIEEQTIKTTEKRETLDNELAITRRLVTTVVGYVSWYPRFSPIVVEALPDRDNLRSSRTRSMLPHRVMSPTVAKPRYLNI